MTRQTSIEVYRQIKTEGLLSKKRLQVYEVLFDDGPLTISEVCKKIAGGHETLSPRFAELRDMGAIFEVGERECRITGRNVIEWDVTSNLPTPKPKMKSKTEIKQELMDATISLGREIDDKWKPQLRKMYQLVLQLINK